MTGFSITRGINSIIADDCSNNIFSSLTIDRSGSSAIRIQNFSTGNVVRDNVITDTGLTGAEFGEGIYVGTSPGRWCDISDCQPDASNNTLIEGNTIGPDVRSEHIDIKPGADNGEIRYNTFVGEGMIMSQAGWPASWVILQGNAYKIHHNYGTDAILRGSWIPAVPDSRFGNDNEFWANEAHVNGADWGFYITNGTTGNVVRCDNVVTGAVRGYSNVSCQN